MHHSLSVQSQQRRSSFNDHAIIALLAQDTTVAKQLRDSPPVSGERRRKLHSTVELKQSNGSKKRDQGRDLFVVTKDVGLEHKKHMRSEIQARYIPGDGMHCIGAMRVDDRAS